MIEQKTYLYADLDRDRGWLNGFVRHALQEYLDDQADFDPVPTIAHGMFPRQCYVRIGAHVIAVVPPRRIDATIPVGTRVITFEESDLVVRNILGTTASAPYELEGVLVIDVAFTSPDFDSLLVDPIPFATLSYLTEEHLAQLQRV